MTIVEELARFVADASFEDLSDTVKKELKIRLLDSIGCAIGALGAEPILMLRTQIEDFGGEKHCTLIAGGKTAPDLAALYNGALVRYLDFNDSYLAKGESCHPSDNIGAVLAASEYAEGNGKDLLLAIAVAYQVQCRLSDIAPVRRRGFDHTTQGSYAVAAGVSKALHLNQQKTAHAIAISGTALNALRVTRTGALSHWKGLAYPYTGFAATHATFLAMRGITGPLEVFEGEKGFMETVSGRFDIDWSKEELERVTKTIVKKYNAEVHSQSAVEGILELKTEHNFNAADVENIEMQIFDVAYHIIGGGEEGDKTHVSMKEQADHSLPFIVAVALLDGQVMPQQYKPSRILRDDVQSLLRKIIVKPCDDYSRLFPDKMPCRIVVHLKDGRVVEKEKYDYEGFLTRPLTWENAVEKFESLTTHIIGPDVMEEVANTVANVEDLFVGNITELLGTIPDPKGKLKT
jgi:2-methylcitrate dehydratase